MTKPKPNLWRDPGAPITAAQVRGLVLLAEPERADADGWHVLSMSQTRIRLDVARRLRDVGLIELRYSTRVHGRLTDAGRALLRSGYRAI